MNTYQTTVIAKAQWDFKDGCTLSDNPFSPGTEPYRIWAEELKKLSHKETLREFYEPEIPCGVH